MLQFKEIENNIKKDIYNIFDNILKKHNYILDINSRSRSGAEISDYLEDEFVNYVSVTHHKNVINPKGAPKDKPKNPYDFCFDYYLPEFNFKDLIWGDIKATKMSFSDSNPDLGTPSKIIKFIKEGHFYLLFVFFNYDSTKDNKIKFIPFENGEYVKCVFLKDIHHSVRINPKPQFQVNINMPEEYRSIDEFMELFYIKYYESIERIINNQIRKKNKLESTFNELNNKIEKYKLNKY